MPGYLAHYGEGEEQREKIIRWTLISVLVLAVVGGTLYFFLKNYTQENQVRAFFKLLERHDYQGAYAVWGCTETTPCRDYAFNTFLEDWGPKGSRADVSTYSIRKSRSCGSGVIITVDFGKNQEEKLWVERRDLTIGFSPWPGCPPGK